MTSGATVMCANRSVHLWRLLAIRPGCRSSAPARGRPAPTPTTRPGPRGSSSSTKPRCRRAGDQLRSDRTDQPQTDPGHRLGCSQASRAAARDLQPQASHPLHLRRADVHRDRLHRDCGCRRDAWLVWASSRLIASTRASGGGSVGKQGLPARWTTSRRFNLVERRECVVRSQPGSLRRDRSENEPGMLGGAARRRGRAFRSDARPHMSSVGTAAQEP